MPEEREDGKSGCRSEGELVSHGRIPSVDDGKLSIHFNLDNREINRAIGNYRKAISCARKNDHPSDLPAKLLLLGRTIERRYSQTWQVEDVQERISLYREALIIFSSAAAAGSTGFNPLTQLDNEKLSPARSDPIYECYPTETAKNTNQDVFICRIELARALQDRYWHNYDMSDVEEAIILSREVLDILPKAYLERASALCILGTTLRIRFERLTRADDIMDALKAHREACGKDYVHLEDRPMFLSVLGWTLFRRYSVLRNTEDLTEAIALQREALLSCDHNAAFRHQILYLLGLALWAKFHQDGKMQELDEAIDAHRKALSLRPAGHRDRHHSLHGLAAVCTDAFSVTDKEELYEEAHTLFTEALLTRVPGHPERRATLNLLSTTFMDRFERLGVESDLDQSIKIRREVLGLFARDEAFRDYSMVGLAGALVHRYRLRGKISHLEESAKLLREVIEISSPGLPIRAAALNNLGGTLIERFRHCGEISDLDEALVYLRECVTLYSYGSLDRALAIAHVADTLAVKYEESGQLKQLDESIDAFTESIACYNAGFRGSKDTIFRGLAIVLLLRYRRTGDSDDLTHSLKRYEETLSLQSHGHPLRYESLRGLGNVFRFRLERSGTLRDASEAEQAYKQALTLLPKGHPERVRVVFDYGRLHLVKGAPCYNPEIALQLLSEALHDHQSSAQIRLTEAQEILKCLDNDQISLDFASKIRLLDAYRLAVELLPRLAYLGMNIHSRVSILAKVESLASSAAVHALSLEETKTAVEILEEGRALLWLQLLQLRSSFEALPDDLAKGLRQLSQELEANMKLPETPSDPEHRSKALLEAETARRRQMGEEFENLLHRARAIPGFERFMQHETYAALSGVATEGPVIVLVSGRSECYAIIIPNTQDQPERLKLRITMERMQKLALLLRDANHQLRNRRAIFVSRSGDIGSKDILSELWIKVVKPVLEHLSLPVNNGNLSHEQTNVLIHHMFSQKHEGINRPRLWWIPTGAFTFAPIHAAGQYGVGALGECCSDYVVSSYTPTIGSLITARRGFLPIRRSSIRMLLAAVSRPFKMSEIPYADEEVDTVKGILDTNILLRPPSRSDDTSSVTSSATARGVLAALPDFTMLHLACHGYQDRQDALKSGFVMDEMLTLSQLLSLTLKHAFLAFLSACETAKGDEKQPDQAIHLAATMLFVGFRSVIGTMW